MFVGVGAGAFGAGIFHLVTHAFFKALLFLGAGSVIHAMHQAYHASHSHDDPQDMRNMGGLKQYLPVTYGLMLIATLAIAGIPPFSGFFSKDSILAAAFARGQEAPIWYVFYAVGLFSALLTAFYMARLMAMTFLGQNRMSEVERSKLHDAPPSMTGPLILLGILSVVGGVINLPAFVGGHEALDRWLEPVVGSALRIRPLELPHGQTEFLLVGAAVIVGIVGLVAGFRATLGASILPARQAPAEHGFARVLYRKFYVDEIYNALIVRPVVWFADRVLWRTVDQAIVDGAIVTGTVRASESVGWLGSRLQNGQLGFYAVLFVLGAVWVLRAILG
jgi:NADH-quinone oxidoreductase subunit L